jgi:hypothetical protein
MFEKAKEVYQTEGVLKFWITNLKSKKEFGKFRDWLNESDEEFTIHRPHYCLVIIVKKGCEYIEND